MVNEATEKAIQAYTEAYKLIGAQKARIDYLEDLVEELYSEVEHLQDVLSEFNGEQ